jgi:2-iminobutanoate/2-iminopropanoate deaminase
MLRVFETLPSLAPAMKSAGLAHAVAIESNGLIFLSGLTAFDIETGQLGSGPFEADAVQTLDVLKAVLGDLGLSLDNVIKVNAYLQEPTDFAAWNALYKATFATPRPCRTSVVGLIELDIVASRESRR